MSDGPLQKSGRAFHASDGLAGWGFHVVDLRDTALRFTAKGQEGFVGALPFGGLLYRFYDFLPSDSPCRIRSAKDLTIFALRQKLPS